MAGYVPAGRGESMNREDNLGKRAERSLDWLLRTANTEQLKWDGSEIHRGHDASADYWAVEIQRARWLVMERVRWEGLFGDRQHMPLADALVNVGASSGIQKFDSDFAPS